MRVAILLLFVLGAQASWFGADTPDYPGWNTDQLAAWLKAHNVPIPTHAAAPPTHVQLQELVKANWVSAQEHAQDAYDAASHYNKDAYDYGQQVLKSGQQNGQAAFDNVVETWDESRLRQFLLEHGVVEPKGPREQLVVMAKQKYNQYLKQTQRASAYIAQATADIGRKASDERDWAYSTWDDSQLRNFLVEKGILKSKQQATRDEMVAKFQEYYRSAADPVWEAWSDSYLQEWLVDHHIPTGTSSPPTRPSLLERIQMYHYDITQKVWNTWSESEMKTWLVDHGVVKGDAQIARGKLEKLIADNYLAAEDSVWAAWRDADIRTWLVEHDYATQETADKMTREKLVKTINKKYNAATARADDYLVWPDARLRAFLRENGVSEDALPTARPGLLQETRIRWVQAQHTSDALYKRILALLSGGAHIAEEKLQQVLHILTGAGTRTQQNAQWAGDKVSEDAQWAKFKAGENAHWAGQKAEDGTEWVSEKTREGVKAGAGKVEEGANKVKTEL
ncbi:hypothetical protein OF83DRAFT_1134392 [Amylostereum chailletii]|nr:hypothetical protein OF83DRAFT_1134392 [Amylostereum chailletii]